MGFFIERIIMIYTWDAQKNKNPKRFLNNSITKKRELALSFKMLTSTLTFIMIAKP